MDDVDAIDIEISEADDAETDEEIVDDMAEAPDTEEADPALIDGLFEEEETGDIDPEETEQIRNIIVRLARKLHPMRYKSLAFWDFISSA